MRHRNGINFSENPENVDQPDGFASVPPSSGRAGQSKTFNRQS